MKPEEMTVIELLRVAQAANALGDYATTSDAAMEHVRLHTPHLGELLDALSATTHHLDGS